MTFQDALDEIYHWYMEAKPALKGRFDRDVRDPQIVIGIARALDLLPPPKRILRVTGSKGKGTVSRTLANALRRLGSRRVGLVVSPEEFEHTDRMKIDGIEITQDEFLKHYIALRDSLLAAAEALSQGRYLSPSGIFLLIALSWFKARDVDLFVLETGRGAQFDETGQIPSAVSAVTSIFLEHAGYLGPELKDIAADKLHIARSSDTTVLGPSAAEWQHLLPCGIDSVVVSVTTAHRRETDYPAWMHENLELAERALSAFLGRDAPVLEGDLASAAFRVAPLGPARLYVEPLISAASLDNRFLDGLVERYGEGLAVIASLPDDKEINGVIDALSARDVPVFHIVLHGTRGYLSYETTKSRFAASILADLRFDDVDGLQSVLTEFVRGGDRKAVYIVGTHTFIRAVKLALREVLGAE